MLNTDENKLKIIYLMGMGRSGGTLIGRVLGQLDSAIYIGELRYLKQRGIIDNSECSCGNNFKECGFWSVVCKDSIKKPLCEIQKEMSAEDRFNRTRSYFYLFWMRLFYRLFGFVDNESLEFCKSILPLYQNIAECSGCNLLVESSRYPSRALALSMCNGLDVYVVHLVRDPRGVINSQLKVDRRNKRKTLRIPIKRVVHLLLISFSSTLTKLVLGKGRYVIARYEDFTASPLTEIKRIYAYVDEVREELACFSTENQVMLDEGHIFSANENRFCKGLVEIRQDTSWTKSLPDVTRRFVTIASFIPMLVYGYFFNNKK